MPDPMLMLEAMAAAAVTAAALSLLCAWLWAISRPGLAAAGSVLGVAFGFYVGCWMLGLRPHWPPQEDQGRFLLLLFPAVIGVELIAAFFRRFTWLVWLLRIGVASSAAPLLLYNSSYLTELAGPGTREWTPAQTWLVLSSMAAALLAVWALLNILVRSPHSSLPPKRDNTRAGKAVLLAVVVACAGAAVTIMLSGYASGGQLGLPLAGAVGGSAAAALVLRQSADREGAVSVGIVGLFALLVMGRFFGELTTVNALLLFFGPVLCWFAEGPYMRRIRRWLRGLLVLILATIPIAVAVTLAQQKFVSDSARTSPGSQEPSIQDYLDFGK